MNPLDRSLQKLLAAAARAPRELAEPAPFSLEAAVIAQLRTPAPEDEFARLVPLFRYAIVFGLAMMLFSGAWNYFGSQSNSGTTALASYAITQLRP